MDKQTRLIELLEKQGVTLNPVELNALAKCFGQRGKYKGYLTRKAPNSRQYPLANAIYNAITPNPYKMQICNLMFMPDDCRETYNKLSRFNYPTWLDYDREALTKMGAW